MNLDTIVRRFTRRKFPVPFSNGSRTREIGYIELDPDTGSLNINVENMYAKIIENKPYNEIDFNDPRVSSAIDEIADEIDDHVQKYVYSLATNEALNKINNECVAILQKHKNNRYW